MLEARIIPVLLVSNGKLVKTTQFKKENYIGDPINAVKIFNEKYVDEISILDISASREGKEPDYSLIERISNEAFMPFAYGGGITDVSEVKKILRMGVEKVVIGSAAFFNKSLITQAVESFGSQSIVVSVDVKSSFLGKRNVFVKNGKKNTRCSPVDYVKRIEALGAGEIILNNIDREGTYKGFDINLIKEITQAVRIPVIAVGGANSAEDLLRAIKHGGASASAAGSLFIYYGANKAVLINYPWEHLQLK